MIKRYIKRPVEVQAVQWTGDNKSEIKEFVGNSAQFWQLYSQGHYKQELNIQTLEGTHYASIGDYIIRGIKGEFYPCKPDIFEKTYEEVIDARKEESIPLYTFNISGESGLLTEE